MAPRSRPDRAYEVVLFGATGFTGGLTAEHIVRHAPTDLRWAVAGRSQERLTALVDRLEGLAPGRPRVRSVVADVGDVDSLRALAASTAVVATTVGPYLQFGQPLVAACAAEGTDYLDIAGEPEFVDTVWLRHHDEAVRTGARLVHACGFDSIPYDLGTLFTVQRLPSDLPITIECFVRAKASFSSGTYHSAVRALGRARQASAAAKRRRGAEGGPTDRRVRCTSARPKKVPGQDRWAVPLPTLDPVIVCRSARALPAYGPDFGYGHYAVVGSLPMLAATGIGAGAVLALARLTASRRLLLGLKKAGEGPSEQERAGAWFQARFVARAGDVCLVTEVSGGDPGYDETAVMLGQSALCLVRDDLPVTAGQVTSAHAMGQPLIERLQAAGLTFRVVEG
ncbi:MAG: saccharopine dehydrogenase NADP-binding domain-containing protein [Actinomycetota bacterium]|nr:saccharopine dehydrogenase NADP-binding domain-containing protein [Actinomycetota bacterium]